MKIIYLLIYWGASGLILLMPQIIEEPNRKLRWKDWLPTFVLAPLIFPFYMIMLRHRDAWRPHDKKRDAEKNKAESENSLNKDEGRYLQKEK